MRPPVKPQPQDKSFGLRHNGSSTTNSPGEALVKLLRYGSFCLGLFLLTAAAHGQTQSNDDQQPAQQPPAQQQPQQPTQPAPPDQVGRPNVKLPPPPPKMVDVRMPGEAGISIGLTGWQPFGDVYVDKGHASN